MKVAATVPADPGRCPLCGDPNDCAMAAGKSDCWCRDRTFPPAILLRVPADDRDRICVCSTCLEAAGGNR